MPDNTLPPRLLRTPEAARFLGMSPRTLEKHRTFGTGPVYQKLGGRVVYALDELQLWIARGRRISTTDKGTGTVYPPKRRDNLPPLPRPKPNRPKTPGNGGTPPSHG